MFGSPVMHGRKLWWMLTVDVRTVWADGRGEQSAEQLDFSLEKQSGLGEDHVRDEILRQAV